MFNASPSQVKKAISGAGFAEQKLRVDLFRKGFLLDDRFDEPTYLTFYLDFDFGANITDNNTSLLASPLFCLQDKSKMGVSANEFLNNRKRENLAKMLSTFNTKLEYININTPWYFQKINGLDKLWGSVVQSQKLGFPGELEIEVGCLESIDLRMLQLAELYQECVFDQTFIRSIIPDNLRKFHMSIMIGEVRDIYNNIGDVSKIKSRGSLIGALEDATNGSSSTLSQTKGTVSNTSFRINSLYYYKFDCYNCEFDFSPVFNPSLSSFTQDKPNETSFKIKIGRVESSGSFGEESFTSNLYRDKFSSNESIEATRKLLLDEIGVAQRNGLSRENLTLLKLANMLGPFSQAAKSKLLQVDRRIQQVTRAPQRFLNSALSEVQRHAENGSLSGSLGTSGSGRNF